MGKILTDWEKKQRENNSNYFMNGKPKKSSMLCRDKSYIAMIKKINGHYDPNWVCGGNSCPLYKNGCDNRGMDWE